MSSNNPATPFPFMDLPPELRIHVYEELLVVGRIFYLPDAYDISEGCRFGDYDTVPKPSLSILRVSKAVCEEAEEVYLGRNTFVLPPVWDSYLPFGRDLPFGRTPEAGWFPNRLGQVYSSMFSSKAFEKLRHISIALCLRASNVPIVMGHSDWGEDRTFDRMTETERLNYAHNNSHVVLDDIRQAQCEELARLENLQSIEIDFTNAYCPLGSCRHLEFSWYLLSEEVQKFRLIGLRRGEKDEILQHWEYLTDLSADEIVQRFQIDCEYTYS